LCFAGANFFAMRYNLQRGKTLLIAPRTRANIYLMLGCQWLGAALIYALGWEQFIRDEETGGYIFGVFVVIAVAVPLLLQYLEWGLYRIREPRNGEML
jgi:hypothetical protein